MKSILSRTASVLASATLLAANISTAAENAPASTPAAPPSYSGIYPGLAYWNKEGECGTGAVVPWADRLWVITYGPHKPNGSTDKLYEINSALQSTIRPESVGGTPANRMIHRESNQLFIGPYIIDAKRYVRVIAPGVMPGRLTGNARHLSDPSSKIYYATMEEGFYEVDVNTLAVKELYKDANSLADHGGPLLPGYHGKGLYSGQGRLVYANNGELSSEARVKPDIASGVLAEWQGADWKVVRRNQFTEITGPGGIEGNPQPATDPLWSIGWDHRSLLLMLLDHGTWTTFRLPKASHCYDGAHGWNTEWPRIRDIGEDSLLMTMHGAFWKFPKTFSLKNTAGIAPRSTYLKVIGDFCRWNDQLVLGCDDSAKSEFLNKRKVKGALPGPAFSHSNLWFLQPSALDQLGAARGAGAVWLNEPVKANAPSDPYLFSGFQRRAVHLTHDNAQPVEFSFEVDRQGDGKWQPLRKHSVPPRSAAWVEFPATEVGAWIRVSTSHDCALATAYFTGSNCDQRPAKADSIFDGLAVAGLKTFNGGLLYAGGQESPTLQFATQSFADGKPVHEGLYEMTETMKLARVADPKALAVVKSPCEIPVGSLQADAASLIFIDDNGTRYRIPRGGANPADSAAQPAQRVCREVCTERDLFQAGGIFYELPANNAGGFAKVRPIATHPFQITDYCSWRGLLVLSGIDPQAPPNSHIVRSEDGKCAVWLGAPDDLWKLGRATGHGGPWAQSQVKFKQPSDPYLCNGFEQISLALSHDAAQPIDFTVEIDITGTGHWTTHQTLRVAAGQNLKTVFPEAFAAYWLGMCRGALKVADDQLVLWVIRLLLNCQLWVGVYFRIRWRGGRLLRSRSAAERRGRNATGFGAK